jgi:HEAT repeat protein
MNFWVKLFSRKQSSTPPSQWLPPSPPIRGIANEPTDGSPTPRSAASQANDQGWTFEEIFKLINTADLSVAEKWRLIYFCFDKLEAESADDRRRAAKCLQYLPDVGDETAIERLMAALAREEDLAVIPAIIWALRGLEATSAISRLQAMLYESKLQPLRDDIEAAIEYLYGS